MRELKLAFQGDPVFLAGTNVTVRHGLKWFKAVNKGQETALVLNGRGEVVTTVILADAFVCKICDLPREWLAYSPYPSAIETFGALRETYARSKRADRQLNVNYEDYVTVLFFRV